MRCAAAYTEDKIMALRLVKASCEFKEQIAEIMEEWLAHYDGHDKNELTPRAIFRNDYRDFDCYISRLERDKPQDGMVPASTFFCFDDERNIMVGAVNIRHYLNDYLLKYGGHIRDGISPSERRKGYATKMIALALDECRKLGLQRVLMVCDRDNVGSAKSIINNGGVLENEVEKDGVVEQRYWIELR